MLLVWSISESFIPRRLLKFSYFANDLLFLNFGSRQRAEEYLQQKIDKGLPEAAIKRFEVPKSFLEELRKDAVEEVDARLYPNNPFIVDETKAGDQFGLRNQQIDQLSQIIIQGSGVKE